MMWYPLFVVLLAGAVNAVHFQAWKTDTEYQYLVRGRTLAALHDISDQYTGIILKAVLTVKPKSEDTLEAKVSKAQFARIHTKLPEGWKSEISDSMVDLKQLPMSEKVFEVKMRHGIVRDVIVDRDVPTWEVNMLKSIVSQLQVDTQGENLMPSRYNQEPEENRVNAMYKTMEDSVGGRCEVLYDITPLPEYGIGSRHERAPNSDLPGEGEAIHIVKTKNYTNCEQRMSHHFGITGSSGWEPSTNNNGQFMSRSSISRIIITGDLKTFTIQSSVTTDKVILSPNFHDNQKGMVGSRVNLTLVRMGPVSSSPWSVPANCESTGNLVYNYNNPFAGPGEDRRPGQMDSNSHFRNSDERVRFLDDMNQKDDSSASRSSKSANSLESNEQQRSYWQPKPMLNDAPFTPLLPFFIGNGGKSIQKSADIDPVMAVKRLAIQIGSDLQNPSTITEEQTLEKFTILVRMLRTMSTPQIADAQRELYQSSNEIDSHDQSQSVRRSSWVAFRDAVAQAGTGPALVTIKNLIMEKKIRGIEAASVVGVLSKTAITPTPEYMDAFFKMATMPETADQEFLNSTAMITFAELVRYSQVNHASAHNRYPVHSFGRLSPKHNPAIFHDYIPHMAEQLRKAIENNEFAKSHVFIRALGAIAHPKILAVLEPYLEGRNKASTFQRLLMVMSMNKLASLRPRLARGVLYRIYQNTAEAHQLRCAAVTFLVSTNPPANMLQRMAEFTNYDNSKQVNAAVKSAIESASELTRPEAQDLAMKARNVRSLLNKEVYGSEYSNNVLMDEVVSEMNLAYRVHAAHIGSEDSFIPQALYTSLEMIYGDFKVPKSEFGAMVSSVKDLYRMWRQQSNGGKDSREQQDTSEFSPEKIAKLLNIETKSNDDLEGAMWMNNKFHNKFLSFDKHSLHRMSDLLQKASASLKDGYNFNMAKIESYDVTLSFPMESGLPFLYTFKAPGLLKLSGSAKGHINPESVEGSLDIRVVHAIHLEAKLGFITPFERQHYLAGVNKNYQIHLPIRAKVNIDKHKKRTTLKLEPIHQNQEYKIIQVSEVPFTSRHDILSMSPVMKDKETHKLIRGELWKRPLDFGGHIKVQYEAEFQSMISDEDLWKYDPITRLAIGFANDKIGYTKTEVSLIPDHSNSQSVTLTASFEKRHDDSSKRDMNRNQELKAKAPQVKSHKLDDPERRKQLLEEAAEGITAPDAFAIDLGIDLPGDRQEPSQFLMTLAHADSNVDEKSRSLLYSRMKINKNSAEMCATLESQTPRVSIFDMEVAGKSPTRSRRFDMDLRAGVTCDNGHRVRINGTQEQSDEDRKALNSLPSMMKCLKEVKRGTKSLTSCQEIRLKLSTMDHAQMTVRFDPEDRAAKEELADYIAMLGDLDDATTYRQGKQWKDKDTLKFTLGLDSSDNRGTLTYSSSDTGMVVVNVDMGPLGAAIGNVDPDMSLSERMNMELSDVKAHQHMCVIDSDSTTTFDQATYPMNLGKCWHVAMTTSPKNNRDTRSKNKLSEDMKLTILVRDSEDKKKEVKIALGNMQLKLKSDTDDKNCVTVDGKDINFNDHPIYRHRNGEDNDIEVFQREDGSVKLVSSKYDVDAIFDGRHLRIKASGKYRSDVRGLCGNYDGEPDNDFTSPKNCILKKSEDFVASYALSMNDCQGPARERSRKVSEAVCHHKTIRPGNVVSDREAGRKDRGQSNWGYHKKQNNDDENENRRNKDCTTARTKIMEEEDQICFSLRPVPTCAPGCEPGRMKSKSSPMYCMQRGSAAEKMAERINNGANPDLSQKQSLKNMALQIPVTCNAA